MAWCSCFRTFLTKFFESQRNIGHWDGIPVVGPKLSIILNFCHKMVEFFVSSLFLVSKFCSWILSKNLAIWNIFVKQSPPKTYYKHLNSKLCWFCTWEGLNCLFFEIPILLITINFSVRFWHLIYRDLFGSVEKSDYLCTRNLPNNVKLWGK